MEEQTVETLSWSVPEYSQRHHSNDWYWGVGLITLAIVITAIVFGNFLFGVLLFIGIGSLMYFSTREPQLLTVSLESTSLKINETLFPYSKIKAFWIEEANLIPEGHDRHLLLMTDKRVMPLVAVPIGDVHPVFIKERLAPHIKEEELSESKMHVFLELLGF